LTFPTHCLTFLFIETITLVVYFYDSRYVMNFEFVYKTVPTHRRMQKTKRTDIYHQNI